MRILALAAIVASVFAAGCGGKSDGGLRAYLRRVNAEQARYEAERAQVIHALASIHPYARDGSWTRAARTLKSAAQVYHSLAERMSRIHAPSALEERHGGLARSLLLYEEIIDTQQAALARRDVVFFVRAVSSTQPLANQAHRLRLSWRVAARSAAQKAGVAFPPRLLDVGT